MSGEASTGSGLFVSYRRQDEADMTSWIVDRLIRDLPGTSVFFDVDSIKPGHDFREAITSYLSRSCCVIVAIGSNWHPERLHDELDFVRLELLEAHRQDRFVLPLLLKSATMPLPSELPTELQWLPYIHAVRIEPHPNFGAHYALLLETVAGELDPESLRVRKAERLAVEERKAKAEEQRRRQLLAELEAKERAEADRLHQERLVAEAAAVRQRQVREQAEADRRTALEVELAAVEVARQEKERSERQARMLGTRLNGLGFRKEQVELLIARLRGVAILDDGARRYKEIDDQTFGRIQRYLAESGGSEAVRFEIDRLRCLGIFGMPRFLVKSAFRLAFGRTGTEFSLAEAETLGEATRVLRFGAIDDSAMFVAGAAVAASIGSGILRVIGIWWKPLARDWNYLWVAAVAACAVGALTSMGMALISKKPSSARPESILRARVEYWWFSRLSAFSGVVTGAGAIAWLGF